MKFSGFKLDLQALGSAIVTFAGIIVVNAPTLLPFIPAGYEKEAGLIVAIAGILYGSQTGKTVTSTPTKGS